VQGLAAAVQGIEAITRGEVGVRSLQEHAARLRGPGADRAGASAGGGADGRTGAAGGDRG
jgi:carbamoyl-phosphate synthase large subunit